MPPKSAPVGDTVYTINGVNLTASDMKLIFGVLNNLTAPIEADLDAAAAFAGYTVGSFKKMWPTLKKKCNIDSVGGAKQTSSTAPTAATTAENDSGEAISTPKKTPGGGGRGGRGRASNKKVLAEGISNSETGDPDPLTPGVPAGMKALSVADAGLETPDTPSKSIFGGMNTTSAKKRTAADAADAADADPDAILMDETPAKKKPARKPRVTAKQKREAAAAAAETAAATSPAPSDTVAAGSDGDKNIDVAMEDGHGGSDSGEI